jgi:hypothetical protein
MQRVLGVPGKMEVAMNVAEREIDNHVVDRPVPDKRATSPISFGEFLLDILRRKPKRSAKSTPRKNRHPKKLLK